MIDEKNINSLANILEMKLAKQEAKENLQKLIKLYIDSDYTKNEIKAIISGSSSKENRELQLLWFEEIYNEEFKNYVNDKIKEATLDGSLKKMLNNLKKEQKIVEEKE